MAMYHSWGSQNAWLRQILGRNWLYMNHARAAGLGLTDGDWVHVTSAAWPHQGAGEAHGRRQSGHGVDLECHRQALGRLGLAPDAPESKKGFLLNHLIGELLPEREGGYRYSNSDPITGQAAWYDLRVEDREGGSRRSASSAPQFPS